MGAEDAGDALAGLSYRFKMNHAETVAALDSINHLANNMHKGSASDILQFTHRLADTAAQYGVAREQVQALGATWAALEVPAKKGESATRSLFMTLGQASHVSKSAQEGFAALGFSGKELEVAFKKDAQGALLRFMAAVKRAKDPLRVLTQIFGEGNADIMGKLMNGLDKYQTALKLMADKSGYQGSFASEFITASDTASGVVEKLGNQFTRFGAVLGSGQLGAVSAVAGGLWRVVDVGIRLVETFPVATNAIMLAGAALVGLKVASLAGGYAATVFSDGWQLARGGISLATAMFRRQTYALVLNRAATFGAAAGARVVALGQLAMAVASKTGAAAMWLFNAALTNNPIGWVVKGVIAACGAMVWLYNTFEPVRNICDAVFGFVADKAKAVWDFLAKIGSWFGNDAAEAVSEVEARVNTVESRTEVLTVKQKLEADPKGTGGQVRPAPASSWDGTVESDGWMMMPVDSKPLAKPVRPVSPVRPVAAAMPQGAGLAGLSAIPANAELNAQIDERAMAALQGATGHMSGQMSGHQFGHPLGQAGAESGSLVINLGGISLQSVNNGVPSADVGALLVRALKSREAELRDTLLRFLGDAVADQRRVLYAR